jgi:hypothetical protein
LTDEIKELLTTLRGAPYKALGADPNSTAYDTQGTSAAPQGWLDEFRGPELDLVVAGIYNGFFDIPTTNTASNINNQTNILPGWKWHVGFGTNLTAKWSADTGNGSGGRVGFTVVNNAAPDYGYLETYVPLPSDRSQSWQHEITVVAHVPVSPTGSANVEVQVSYVDSDRVAISSMGSAADAWDNIFALPGNVTTLSVGPIVTPPNAGALRVQVALVANPGDAGTAYVTGVWVRRFAVNNYMLIPELPGTAGTPPSGYGALYVNATGNLHFINDSGTDTAIT